jgi:hypothetical protein
MGAHAWKMIWREGEGVWLADPKEHGHFLFIQIIFK